MGFQRDLACFLLGCCGYQSVKWLPGSQASVLPRLIIDFPAICWSSLVIADSEITETTHRRNTRAVQSATPTAERKLERPRTSQCNRPTALAPFSSSSFPVSDPNTSAAFPPGGGAVHLSCARVHHQRRLFFTCSGKRSPWPARCTRQVLWCSVYCMQCRTVYNTRHQVLHPVYFSSAYSSAP